MSFGDVNSIHLLKKLFDKCQRDDGNSSDSEVEGDFPSTSATFGPGNIKPKKSEIKKTLGNSLMKKIDPESTAGSLEEWEKQQDEDKEILDSRKQPKYEIVFKQAVTTEDLFLQMGLKTPATASCEDMIVEVKLDEESVGIDGMDLNVETQSILLQTPVYRLSLALPHKVEPKKSRAEFDKDKKILKLTLRLNREYDFVNF
ncbi:CLUMA_CG007034, isoform A [Clunio marinus]|uniref:CLUMA_CG007034, isoform A n=1 Tax=Clunio marinus TaxID=568069 RepID=A0A1J1I165_9DIPT|nr:CLUMA_CG007034, isoform A [Clunio marinus]